eukprot:5492838-Pyramimonas_sp.AAC.1
MQSGGGGPKSDPNRWLQGPPKLGGRGGAHAADPGALSVTQLVELLQAKGVAKGSQLSADLESVLKKAEEVQPVDLGSKSLQDLLQRKQRKIKQIECSQNRVEAAR